MKYIYKGIKDFDLDHIFDCGQCFRWTKQEDGSYTGIAFGRVVNMQVAGDNKDELVIDGCCEEDFKTAMWILAASLHISKGVKALTFELMSNHIHLILRIESDIDGRMISAPTVMYERIRRGGY